MATLSKRILLKKEKNFVDYLQKKNLNEKNIYQKTSE